MSFLLLGAAYYFLGWFYHDRGGVPNPGAGGALPIRRAWPVRVLRRGHGPVLLVSVLLEVVGLAALARGVVINAGRPEPFEAVTRDGFFWSVVLLGVGFIALYIRTAIVRRWPPPKRDPGKRD
jgi:hypothetical protein